PFVAADNGVKTFAAGATLRKAGTWAITATDAANATLTGAETGIVVTAAAASSLAVSGFPTADVAGVAHAFTVTLTDPFGNVASGYRGTVTFSTTDPLGTFNPGMYPFVAADAGTRTFAAGATLKKAGTWAITAADTTTAGLTGTESGIVVAPAAVSKFVVGGFPAATAAGTANGFTVTATDPFGNTTPAYTGTVALSSPDPQAVFSPATYPFVAADAGTKTFSGTLKTVGTQSITVTDTTAPGVTGTQAGIQVTPAPTAGFVLSGFPATVTIGTSNQLTVTAVDASGNPTPGYTGTVAVGSSDPAAGLPPAAQLTNGVGTFTVVLSTPGTQSLRAADTAAPSLTTLNVLTTNVVAQPVTPPPVHYAAGSGAGGSPAVFVYDNAGNTVFGFNPFGPGFVNGIRVAVGDVNGDGADDYVVGTGPGVPSSVVVIDGQTRQAILTYQPFESSFTGGVFVTTGKISPTRPADIVITPDEGGGPRVVVLEGGDFKKVADFLGIADPNFRGGARTAVGDVTGDGFGDVAVAAGFGGGPRVSVVDGKALLSGRVTHPFNDFFVFGGSDALSLRDGAFIALGDVNGDGFADVIAGGGPGGGPRVRIVSGQDLLTKPAAQVGVIANFFAGSANSRGGIRVAAKSLTGGKNADVVTGDGELEGSTVTAYKGASLAAGGTDKISSFDPFPGFLGGVYVG
ncbi:MAG: hypothetical protein JWO38_7711, partial [Gemmataceae bacterium]|nr:hypothetical protein [Gemmataceae bacterium]